MPKSSQGRFVRSGVLWRNEELNEQATTFVTANAAVNGKLKLTVIDFCNWVNNTLLPNSTLEPGFPRSIALETARVWLHELGFHVLTPRKGIFVDWHERPDVVAYDRELMEIEFLHFTQAPTEEARKAFPVDIEPPTSERRSKLVVFFHDESIFQSNEDESLQWGLNGSKMIKSKSKGGGIMVSDFIGEHSGFLALSDEEYKKARK